MVKQTVYRHGFDYGNFGFPENLKDWPAFIAAIQANAPEEYRSELRIEFDVYSSGDGIEGDGVTVWFKRPGTKAEIDEEQRRVAENQARIVAEEQALLAALKAKYER